MLSAQGLESSAVGGGRGAVGYTPNRSPEWKTEQGCGRCVFKTTAFSPVDLT